MRCMSKFESDAYRATLTGVLNVGWDNGTNGKPEQKPEHWPLPEALSPTTSAVAISGADPAPKINSTDTLPIGWDNSSNGRPEQQLGHRPLPQSQSSTTSAVAIFGSNLPHKIDPDVYYPPQADELRPVAAVQTLARWRHEGRGPPYIKSGSRVLYRGADVLAWLDANRVKTEPPLTARESA
jgi:hypothetical protein